MEDPSLNDSKWAGGTWVSLRVERLNVVLFHMRRLRLSGDLRACASKLTTVEFLQIEEVVELMEKKPDLEEVSALPLVQREEPSPLVEREGPNELHKSSKEPFRAYITGTTDTSGKGKLSLIVENTHRNHPKYLEILEHIKEKLEKDHLTKVEAVELRQQCYQTW